MGNVRANEHPVGMVPMALLRGQVADLEDVVSGDAEFGHHLGFQRLEKGKGPYAGGSPIGEMELEQLHQKNGVLTGQSDLAVLVVEQGVAGGIQYLETGTEGGRRHPRGFHLKDHLLSGRQPEPEEIQVPRGFDAAADQRRQRNGQGLVTTSVGLVFFDDGQGWVDPIRRGIGRALRAGGPSCPLLCS